MLLKDLLEREHSKQQTLEIVGWIDNSQVRFDELFRLFMNSEYRIVQRAAWPLSYAAIQHPELIKKHYKKMLEKFNQPNKPVAVKRNILRILDQIPEIPQKHHGVIMNICFNCIQDPSEAIAAQAFALGILEKLSRQYPQVKPELKLIIEGRLDNAPPAFISRAKKILHSKS